MTTIAQLIAHSLYEVGVRTAFGLPGGEVVEVLDAFRQIGIEFVLVKNESAMGFGIPAAMAAAQITKQPAICITGDGGLAMVMGELSLAVEADLPVIIVVMNDNALDLNGTTFTNPNYAIVAQGYGLKHYHVDSTASCKKAVQAALQARKPCLIDVQIDPSGYPTAVNK